MPTSLRFWTDFADGAVMFPLGIVTGLTLLALRQRRAATGWTIVIGSVWATMLILKFVGYIIQDLLPASPLSIIDLVTPSGHVASATVIYGGLVGLVLWRPGTLKFRTLFAAAAVAAGIGVTRVMLGEHSVSEVVIAAGVGITGAYWLTRLAGVSVDRRARLPLLAVVTVVIVVRHGGHLGWEQTIHHVATDAVTWWRGPA